jgi:hypothetical protein
VVYINSAVTTVTIGNIDIVSTELKCAMHCALSSYVGFKKGLEILVCFWYFLPSI